MEKNDYKNALRVIAECEKYIANELGEIAKNPDFPKYPKLLYLKTESSFYHRGQRSLYLSFAVAYTDYRRFRVIGFCDDGFITETEIGDGIMGSCYTCYCPNKQSLIDLACEIASHWQDIKIKIKEIKIMYERDSVRKTNLLANFQV